jgi:hypothetical protein
MTEAASKALADRITAYLAGGGLFNPELANHDAVRDLLIECRDALSPQPVAPEPQWQPIETAPKDGRTLLLGYFNAHYKWRTLRGSWMSADYIAENWEDPDTGTEGWHETSVEADDPPNCWYTDPTHWMPLPTAPSKQEGV